MADKNQEERERLEKEKRKEEEHRSGYIDRRETSLNDKEKKDKEKKDKEEADNFEEIPYQDRTAMSDDTFDKVCQKLIKAKERYEKVQEISTRWNEETKDLEGKRERRAQVVRDYQQLLDEVNKRCNKDLKR